MNTKNKFIIQYINIEGIEKEISVNAKTAPEAAEIAESGDPDLGEMLFVGTKEEYSDYKLSKAEKTKPKKIFENNFSI